MDEQQWLARRFEEHRPHLHAVAYRMLGSLSEADDAVQDAWIRLSRADTSDVENLGGWLTTVVARVALNMLRSRNTRREQPLDAHVPDPILDPAGGTDPEHETLLADSVGLALLVVLETLTPPERLAFVLHDMFAVPFEDIAVILERSPEATRQLASRARRRVPGAAPSPDADLSAQCEVVDAFLAASRGGDFHALVAVRARLRDAMSPRHGRGKNRITFDVALAPNGEVALEQTTRRRFDGRARQSPFPGRLRQRLQAGAELRPDWPESWQATWPATTCTLISGDADAVLVDSLLTRKESDELASWVRARDKNLTAVYITHAHGDHFFGLNSVLAAYRDAKPVALADIVPLLKEQTTPEWMEIWRRFFPEDQLTDQPIAPGPSRRRCLQRDPSVDVPIHTPVAYGLDRHAEPDRGARPVDDHCRAQGPRGPRR
jgi:RNA polymerase sigma factor (sigma-70 family)